MLNPPPLFSATMGVNGRDLRVAAGYCFVGPSIEFRVGF